MRHQFTRFLQELKIVVIDDVSRAWALPQVQELFNRTVDLKLRGYGAEYGLGVLPLDATDFIGAHQLVCRETPRGLLPIMGYRSTSWERSRLYGQPFAGLNLARSSGAPVHAQAIEELLQDCERGGEKIAYTGSWTIDPELRQDKDLSRLLRELFLAMYVHYHQEEGISRLVTGGTLRFKVDRMLRDWGHEHLGKDGVTLPPIHVSNLVGEPVSIMHLRRFSDEALEQAKRWRFVWNQRLVLKTAPARAEDTRKIA